MPPNALVPTQTYNLTDAEGNVVMQVPPGMVAQFNQMMSRGGNGGTLSQVGDALQVGAGILQASEIRELLRDVRDAQDRLDTARRR